MPAKSLLNDEYVNTNRQITIDILKTFSIFWMIIIHCYEELCVTYYFDGYTANALGKVLEFLGGPLAAPVFMIAMGIGIVYSSHREPKQLFMRGLKLFLFGYLFTFLHDGIREIILYLVYGGDLIEVIAAIVYIDIFQLAGLSFMLTGILKKLKVPVPAMLAIAIGMQVIGNIFVNNVVIESAAIRILLAPFFHSSVLSYFPLFEWYVYPATGIVIAKYLKQISDQERLHQITLGVSSVFLVGLICGCKIEGVNLSNFYSLQNDIYYHQNFLKYLFTIACFFFWESSLFYLRKKFRNEGLDRRITYMADNLNSIYINQWMIYGLLTFLFEFEIIPWLNPALSIPVGIVVLIVSALLAKYTKKIVKL